MTLTDAHCHYDFPENPEGWLEELENVKGMIVLNGIDEESNRRIVSLRQASTRIRIALGYHPTSIRSVENAIKETEYIRQNKDSITAIGEIGLDYYHKNDFDTKTKQREVFAAYLQLAQKINKPVILHTRNAQADVLEMLKEFKGIVVLHCFEASISHIKEAVSRGYYFTIPASVIRNEHFKRLVEHVPISNILTETDAPLQGPTRGVPARPKDIQVAVDYIAEKKQLDKMETENIIQSNFMRIFKSK